MLQTLFTTVLCFVCFSFAFARVVSTSIPDQIKNSWWLSSKEAASIFNGSKKLNVKFDNSKPIVIAILDTGIDFSHPYLKDHEYIPEKGTAHFNFFTGTNEAKDLIDIAGHGTHVAGIVLATIQKANPKANVKFISLKILPDPKPERSSMAIPKISPNVIRYASGNIGLYLKEASSYLVRLKKEGINILALNASYGGYTYDQNEKEALAYLSRNDILVAAAAGNDAKKLTKVEFSFKDEKGKSVKCIAFSKEKPCPAQIFKNFYPAAYNAELDNIIAVGNVNRNGLLGKSSNFGSSVDIFAPGEDIVSSVPGGIYEIKTGTSMATPQVTASLALLKSAYPSKTNLEIKKILLDNSIFNDYYVDKSSSASRLNIPYLFKEKATKYSLKSLMKLNPKSFANDSAKITRDVPCMMSPSNKILCGPEIYKTKIFVDAKEQTIAEILGNKNIERQKALNLGLLGRGQIIESSLNMTIKSISKNEKIFQMMLKHGFAFSDLYHSLGKEFLDKNYEAQVIVPILSYSEFEENYPPGIKVDKELYAKYVKDLVNTPPQFLNRFKSIYLPRMTPDLKVELGLTKIFPLPLTENLMSLIAKNNSPDANVVLKRLPDSFVKKSKDKELILKVKELKKNSPVIALTKKDLKYLDGFNQIDSKADGIISSRLSSSGYRPMSQESFEGIKKAFKAAIPIEKVSGVKIKESNSNNTLALPNKIISRLDIMESALLAASLSNQTKIATRIAKSAPISKVSKKILYQSVKENALVLNKDKNLQLDPTKIKANIIRPEAKDLARLGKKDQEFFSLIIKRSLAGNTAQKRGLASEREFVLIDSGDKTKISTNKVGVPPITDTKKNAKNPKEEETIHALVDSTEITIESFKKSKKDSLTNENYSCDLLSLDRLKSNIDLLKNNRGKSIFLHSVFCEGNSGESSKSALWKGRTEVMQFFNRCDGSSMDKSFVDTLANGIQASGCRPKNIEQSCRDNIVNQLIKVCEKIIGDYEKPIGMGDKIIADRVSSYINTCRNGAIKVLDLFHGYQAKDHRTFLGLINLKDTLQRECVHDEINQSKEIIKAAILNLDQELIPLLSAHINTDSFAEKKKACSFLSEKVKSLMVSKSYDVSPETKLSYKQILTNLPKTNSRPTTWSPLESAAYVLFNENALTIKEEIQLCNSGNERNKGTNRFGKTN